MSDEDKKVKSYKLKLEVLERLEDAFAKSGIKTQDGFFEHMLVQTELQSLKDGSLSGYKEQLDELEIHNRRPSEIILSILNTENAKRIELVRLHDEKLNERSGVIFAQEQQINESNKLVERYEEALDKSLKENSELAIQLEQVREISSKSNLLVDEYSKQIVSLNGQLDQNKAAVEENINLSTKLTEFTKLTEEQAKQLQGLQNELNATKELNAKQAEQQAERYAEDKQRLADQKDLEKERELLAVQTKYQAKLEKASEEATEKIRGLYEQIDKIREGGNVADKKPAKSKDSLPNTKKSVVDTDK